MDTSKFLEQAESDFKNYIYNTSEIKNNILRKQCRIDGVIYSNFEEGLSKINKNENDIANFIVDGVKHLAERKVKINEAYIKSTLEFSQQDGNLMYRHLGKISSLPIATNKVFSEKNQVNHEFENFISSTRHKQNSHGKNSNGSFKEAYENLVFEDLDIVMNALTGNGQMNFSESLNGNTIDEFLKVDDLSDGFDTLTLVFEDWFMDD